MLAALPLLAETTALGGKIATSAKNIWQAAAGFFKRGENTHLLSSIERFPSNLANKPFVNEDAIAKGWKPPYPENITIRRISASKNLNFVRVHTDPTRPTGGFLVRQKVLARMSYNPENIRLYLGLPDVPLYITDVDVPSATNLLVGRIGPQPNFGLMRESGFQYQLEDIIPRSSFFNTKPLESLIEENTEFPQMRQGW